MIRSVLAIVMLFSLTGCIELMKAALDELVESNRCPVELTYGRPDRHWREMARRPAAVIVANEKAQAIVSIAFLPHGPEADRPRAEELAAEFSQQAFVTGGLRDEDRTDEYGMVNFGQGYFQTSFRLLGLAPPNLIGKAAVRSDVWSLDTHYVALGFWPAEQEEAAVAGFDQMVDSLAHQCR